MSTRSNPLLPDSTRTMSLQATPGRCSPPSAGLSIARIWTRSAHGDSKRPSRRTWRQRVRDGLCLTRISSHIAVTPQRRGTTLIEGIGGVLVPLDNEHTVTDWIAALEVPALLVTGSYLGAISHTLTAFEVLSAHDIHVCGIVVSESESQPVAAAETALSIERFSNGCPVVVVPRLRDGTGAPDLLTPLGLAS